MKIRNVEQSIVIGSSIGFGLAMCFVVISFLIALQCTEYRQLVFIGCLLLSLVMWCFVGALLLRKPNR